MTESATRLSEFRGDPGAFLHQLRYDGTDRSRRRFNGDHLLLAGLRQALGLRGTLGEDLANVGVADLGEATLQDIVEGVESRMFDQRWRLTGDESQPILERLDAHFAEPRAAWEEERQQQAERREFLARVAAEQGLNQMRIDLTLARQTHADLGEQIKAMERDLAAEAERLGLPAWPS